MMKLKLALALVLLGGLLHAQTPCVNGMAGQYACLNVDFMSFSSISDLGGGACLNDCWGWTDPLDGKEYALVGACNGTAFVDITDPVNTVYLGNLPTHNFNSSWRDVKVYSNHAFIVSEAGGHGMQVFDLTRLRNVSNAPVVFTEDAHYAGIGKAHNIAINESTARAYIIGANSSGSPASNGGLVILDVSTPTSPALVGSYTAQGYIHDTQCVIYNGPDTDFTGKEICINSHSGNPDKKTIVNVSDPTDVQLIESIDWPGARIGHQGWLTEDHKYFLLGDEGDESNAGHNTRTYVFDVQNLDSAYLVGFHSGTNASIDHNMYTHENLLWQANYSSGLQVLDPVDLATASMNQVGWFDTYPNSDNVGFLGAWSNYPYFPSGNVIISDYDLGFYVVRPTPKLNIKVILEGPYDATTGMMKDDLRVAGYVPIVEPYTGLGYTFIGGGGESCSSSVLNVTGNNAIVDWVLVEVRDALAPANVLHSRSALLQRDGDIVDNDGVSALHLDVAVDSYRIAVRHRNHLGIMTASEVPVSIATESIDFTDGSMVLFGTEPTTQQGTVDLLWSGNVFNDGELKYVGSSNDRDPILVSVGGSAPTATLSGYYQADSNMDGVVKYTGSANDRDPILVGIGGSIPTNTRLEQLP